MALSVGADAGRNGVVQSILARENGSLIPLGDGSYLDLGSGRILGPNGNVIGSYGGDVGGRQVGDLGPDLGYGNTTQSMERVFGGDRFNEGLPSPSPSLSPTGRSGDLIDASYSPGGSLVTANAAMTAPAGWSGPTP